MDLREAIDAVAERVRALLDGLSLDFRFEPEVREADLFGPPGSRGSGLFLGVYDEAEVLRSWEANGVLAALRERLGCGVRIRLDPAAGLLRAYRDDREPGPDALVVEAKVRIAHGPSDPAAAAFGFPAGDLLAVDWILVQSPGAAFRAGRGPLPGQRHPGLGLSGQVIQAILRATQRLGAKGALGTPMHYHLAEIYHRIFAFVDPVAEGRFQALSRALRGRPLAVATRLVEEGRVRDEATGRPYRWEAREMVLPVAEDVRAYVSQDAYEAAAARALSEARFSVVAPTAVEERTALVPRDPPTPLPGAAAAVDEVVERARSIGGPPWPPTSR